MPILKTEAIVLRVMDYSETSLIAWFYTRDQGRLHIIAKGARRPRSPFEGAIEPLARGELVFYRKKKATDGLDIAKEFDPTNRHSGLRRDLARLHRGLYLAELVTELSEREAPSAGTFDALSAGLDRLATCEASALDVHLLTTELSLLTDAGLAPRLDGCARCPVGSPPPTGELYFSPEAGGLLCPLHAQGDPGSVSASPGALKTLRALSQGSDITVSRDVNLAIRDLLDGFVRYHLAKQLRLPRFLRAGGGRQRRQRGRPVQGNARA